MPMTKQINENHWMNHSKGEERGEKRMDAGEGGGEEREEGTVVELVSLGGERRGGAQRGRRAEERRRLGNTQTDRQTDKM